MRNGFINSLTDLARHHEDVFLLCGDLGYSVLEPFAEQFPDRFLNVGIAEQNMTQLAVGLAREGYNVFTYSIGNFPTLRCMEQIRYDVCYHNANVKVVAVGAGYAYGPLGVSHHTTEDISALRGLPNLLICSPGDPFEAKAAAGFMVAHPGPAYIRLNKAGEKCAHANCSEIIMRPGCFIKIREGSDVAVICTGAILGAANQEINSLGLNWALFSAPFVGNYDSHTLMDLSTRFRVIITMEEHQLNGGFGSSLLEALNDLNVLGVLGKMPMVKRLGIPNRFMSCAGTQEYLREQAGLSLQTVISENLAGGF